MLGKSRVFPAAARPMIFRRRFAQSKACPWAPTCAGVKVGTVTSLILNPETFRAEAVFTVSENVALPDDTAVIVSSEGLLGGNFVELLPGGSLENLAPGSEIEDTQSSVGLVELLLKFVSGSRDE